MSRADLQYLRTTLRGGINEAPDSASMEECSEALNVWCPRDRVESRPGYTGVSFLPVSGGATLYGRKYDTQTSTWTSPAAGILDLASMVVNRHQWYIGADAAFNGFYVGFSVASSANTFATCEYWNGSSWKNVAFKEYTGSTSTDLITLSQVKHLNSPGTTAFSFAAPSDWAASTLDTQLAFWVRFRINGANTSAGTAVDVAGGGAYSTYGAMVSALCLQFSESKAYALFHSLSILGTTSTWVTRCSAGFTTLNIMAPFTGGGYGVGVHEAVDFALVPQFSDAFMAYNGRGISARSDFPSSLVTKSQLYSTVEDRDFAIGPNAAYDKRFLAQLQSWPPSKYVLFSNGRLWAANMIDDPYLVRWSAPAPYHKVWPALSYEWLMEDDNSPITMLAVLGEQVVVGKQDSIWLMVNGGANAETGVTHYYPRKVVSGVGCVSNSSVRQIRNRLIFLSEDGLYAFDGTPNIKKITVDQETGVDRLPLTVATINRARRKFCIAAHWRKYRCYLLAVPTNGSVVNDKVIVWEYEKDRWWVWDNIEAQTWLEDEGAGDDERLLFGDSSGRLYEMGAGQTDDGATISSYVMTQRFGYGQNATLRARAVNLLTTNKTRSLSVELTPDDGTATSAQTIDTTDYNEKDWGSLQWGATGADNWASERRTIQRADMSADGNWVQVKVSHNTKYQKMSLSQVELGLEPLGRR